MYELPAHAIIYNGVFDPDVMGSELTLSEENQTVSKQNKNNYRSIQGN